MLLAVIIPLIRLQRQFKQQLLIGLFVHIMGGLAYLYLMESYYGGGDYGTYFEEGWAHAQSMLQNGFGASFEGRGAGKWWGTGFVIRVTAWLLAIIGPTLPGAFIIFSLLGYLGIVALGFAFKRAYPDIPTHRYFIWIAFFPSLWFWPAALGKDALILCGIGVATLGFVSHRNIHRWVLMAAGLGLVFAVRPQVAATLAFALLVGYWLAGHRRWSFGRVLQGISFAAIAMAILSLAGGALGFNMFQPEQVDVYFSTRSSASGFGGSAIDVGESGVSPLMAPINVLFRPLPWEANGLMPLIASAELMVLWVLAFRRRHHIRAFIRAHRRSPLFWMALAFIGMYSAALGLSVGNVGIIARQRVHILPFMFIFFAGVRQEPPKIQRVYATQRWQRQPAKAGLPPGTPS